MPAWLKKIIDAFKALSPNLTDEQLRELEKTALEAVPKPDPQKPDPQKPDPQKPDPQPDPAVAQVLEVLKAMQAKIEGLESYTAEQRKTAEEKNREAQVKRYSDHVESLFKAHRISKAEKDELLAKEKMDAKLPQLESFIEDSNRWAVNPAFAKEDAQQKQGSANDKPADKPTNRAERMRSLEAAAAAEIEQSIGI